MKVLIIGANGQLGRDCRTVLAESHHLEALDLPEIDITSFESVRAWLARCEPDAVVNCAAYTRVDDAETNADICRRVNTDGPDNLARVCAGQQIRLIHISTDYVFDGDLPMGQSYTEDDATNPRSVYGATKLAGERPVLDYEHGAVLRTAWLYGASGPNFLLTMLRLALRQPPPPIRVVNDQVGTPTWSGRLARQIARLLDDFRPGLYHATSQGSCTWYDFAARFLKEMGVPHTLVPITTAEYPTPAKRPRNSILANRNLQRAGMDVMLPWEEDLDTFIRQNRENWIRRVQKS